MESKCLYKIYICNHSSGITVYCSTECYSYNGYDRSTVTIHWYRQSKVAVGLIQY